jgi:hypothetical protein
LGDAMFERHTNGAELRRGRQLQPRDAFAICGFIVGAAAIGAVLSPLAVLCALLVIVVETARRLLEAENERRSAMTQRLRPAPSDELVAALAHRRGTGADLLLRRLALAIGLVCGLLGTQGPEFAQQYRQRLAGAVDELSRVVGTFDEYAGRQNLTPDEAMRRLGENGDPLVRERGQAIAKDKVRLARLQDALAAYAETAPIRRLVDFLGSFDAAVGRRAWSDYQPAVPTTVESLVLGLVGLALGWAGAHLVAWPARRYLARRREEMGWF